MDVKETLNIKYYHVIGIILYIIVIVSFSGCIEDNNDDKPDYGDVIPREESLTLEVKNVNQSGVNCWDAVVDIYNPTENKYNLKDVTISIRQSGTILKNANVTYLDTDSDALVSSYDIIEISNMTTEDPQGVSISMEYQRKRICGASIDWDVEDIFRYMVLFRQGDTTQIDSTHWDSYFDIVSIRGDNQINISDISIAVQKDETTILTSAMVNINDTDDNGILSGSDRIEITSMTEKYRGAAVRLIVNDIQVGYRTIYYFNLEGDTEGH